MVFLARCRWRRGGAVLQPENCKRLDNKRPGVIPAFCVLDPPPKIRGTNLLAAFRENTPNMRKFAPLSIAFRQIVPKFAQPITGVREDFEHPNPAMVGRAIAKYVRHLGHRNVITGD
jgi:hypothetical protein